MAIGTRALRQEVCQVPSPGGFDYEHEGFVFNDGETGVYIRPEIGNHILIGGEEPACDPLEWVDPDDYNRDLTDLAQVQVMRLAQRMPEVRIPPRPRGSSTSTTSPTTGSRSTTGPTCRASTWRSARAATSSRTRRSSAR